MKSQFDETRLHGAWLHAHEEDEPGRMVFRATTHQLPPARGRSGYEFGPDGHVTRIGSGPTDRTTTAQGKWTLDPGGRISIQTPGQQDEILEILAHDGDRLVIKT